MTFNDIVKHNVMRDKGTYISFFLSSVFSIIIFFFFLATAFHPTLATLSTDSTLGITMLLASFIIYLFSFVFIIYSLQAFLKKKMKLLGVLSMVGASRKQLNRFTFRENMFVGLLAIITAILLGLIILPLFFMIMKNLLVAETFKMYFPIKAISMTIIVFVLLFGIVSLIMNKLIKKGATLELLKNEHKVEVPLKSAPILTITSFLFLTALLVIALKQAEIFNQYGFLLYPLLFLSFLSSIFFIVTQSLRLFISYKKKHLKTIDLLFISNIIGKQQSHSKIIYALSLLIIGVFISTSVLFSSYNDVEKKTAALYPYTVQYTSLPGNSSEELHKDLEKLTVFFKNDSTLKRNQVVFKGDESTRTGFMPLSSYNHLEHVETITLNNSQIFAVAGNNNVPPNTAMMNQFDFLMNKELIGENKENILSTGLRDTIFVLTDSVYESVNLEENHVYLFESDHWKTIGSDLDKVLETMPSNPDKRLVASKAGLYTSERFVKSVMFFIGVMLSLIFLCAAMSILYFYLQSNLVEEKKKYQGIRKIGLSKKELKQIVSKELAMLIFIPFTLASLLMVGVLLSLGKHLSMTFIQTTTINFSLFLSLFIISFFTIRYVYTNKLVE